jgi:hypothetical protein
MVHLSYFFKVSHPFWVAVYQSIINLCGGRNCIFFKCTLETSLSTRYRQHLQYILGDSTVAWGSCHITHNCVYFCLKLDCNVGVQSCKRALESWVEHPWKYPALAGTSCDIYNKLAGPTIYHVLRNDTNVKEVQLRGKSSSKFARTKAGIIHNFPKIKSRAFRTRPFRRTRTRTEVRLGARRD